MHDDRELSRYASVVQYVVVIAAALALFVTLTFGVDWRELLTISESL
ncbi:hypothetical protein [Aureimonas leprariae]|nr:hypothetical protein [Aureimonas leprariae]